MQQARQVANGFQRTVGDLARSPDLTGRPAASVNAAFGQRQLHFQRGQDLADLVVQLASDRPPLFLLRRDEGVDSR
jgi:hypothetical protein